MDMNDFLLNAQKYAPDFFINYCVINGAIIKLDEVQNMGCMELTPHCLKCVIAAVYAKNVPNI